MRIWRRRDKAALLVFGALLLLLPASWKCTREAGSRFIVGAARPARVLVCRGIWRRLGSLSFYSAGRRSTWVPHDPSPAGPLELQGKFGWCGWARAGPDWLSTASEPRGSSGLTLDIKMAGSRRFCHNVRRQSVLAGRRSSAAALTEEPRKPLSRHVWADDDYQWPPPILLSSLHDGTRPAHQTASRVLLPLPGLPLPSDSDGPATISKPNVVLSRIVQCDQHQWQQRAQLARPEASR